MDNKTLFTKKEIKKLFYYMSYRLLLPLALVVMLGAGCAMQAPPKSSDNNQPAPVVSSPVTTPGSVAVPSVKKPAPKTTPAPAPTPAPKAVHVPVIFNVSITDTGFEPKSLILNVGDSIIWTNNSTKHHTSVADQGPTWDSGDITLGASYKKTFNVPGGFLYHCGSHPAETGNITVF